MYCSRRILSIFVLLQVVAVACQSHKIESPGGDTPPTARATNCLYGMTYAWYDVNS